MSKYIVGMKQDVIMYNFAEVEAPTPLQAQEKIAEMIKNNDIEGLQKTNFKTEMAVDGNDPMPEFCGLIPELILANNEAANTSAREYSHMSIMKSNEWPTAGDFRRACKEHDVSAKLFEAISKGKPGELEFDESLYGRKYTVSIRLTETK